GVDEDCHLWASILGWEEFSGCCWIASPGLRASGWSRERFWSGDPSPSPSPSSRPARLRMTTVSVPLEDKDLGHPAGRGERFWSGDPSPSHPLLPAPLGSG